MYIILKGITQFGYINCDLVGKCMITDRKINKFEHSRIDGNCVIKMNEIKIKDFKKWSPNSESDLIDNAKDLVANSQEELKAAARLT